MIVTIRHPDDHLRDGIIGNPPTPLLQTVRLTNLVPDAISIGMIFGLASINHLAGPPKVPVDRTLGRRIECSTIETFKTNPFVIGVPDRDFSPVIVWPFRNVPDQFLINEFASLDFPRTRNATNEHYRPYVA